MHLSFQALVLAVIFLFPFLSSAQQFAGAYIPNSLPAVLNANITFFNLKDAKGNKATFTNYLSLNTSGKYLPGAAIKRLVIVIHGLGRDPGTYMAQTLSALSQVPAGLGPSLDNTQIICPYFPNGDDKNIGYPWTDGLSPGKGSTSNQTVWQASNWASGDNNQYPWNRYNISSYGALDQVINYYDQKTLYPNLQQIVVAGHSLGGQMIQRYVAVGDVLNTKTPVSYWIGNPNSVVWFAQDRPLDPGTCTVYDNWRYGFNNPISPYGADIFAAGRNASLARYNSRHITYGRGIQDFGDDSSTCSPFSTGQNRAERLYAFIARFPPTSNHHVDLINCGHDYGCMSGDPAGQARLFLDNFNGNATALDQGCPRLAAGDSPNPNPSCGVVAPVVDAGTYNGYTYQGCYTDSARTSLRNFMYDQLNNTIEMCTSTCAAAGYKVAGVEYGSQCMCDNALTAGVHGPLVENACTKACTGNSSQVCGDGDRLSIFSIGPVVISQAPSMPGIISSYSYQGCFTDPSGMRGLTGSGTSNSNMTAENCVSFCSGYRYAAMEYADECYCGNSLASTSVITNSTDCSMTCAGNDFEYCGGASRMNLYYSNSTIVSTSTSTTTSNPASPTGTSGLSCPSSDGVVFSNTSSGASYTMQCYQDHQAGDLYGASASSFEACIQLCDQTASCLGASYVPGNCYMKNVINAAGTNNAVWGFVLSSVGNSTVKTTATTGASTSTTSTSTASTASSTVLTCPSSNGVVYNNTGSGLAYTVQCYQDHAAADIASGNTATFNACINLCDTTTGCVAASWVGGPCYMKNAINPASTNNAVWGFVLSNAASGSISTTTTSASSSTVASTTASGTKSSASSTSTALSCPASNGVVYNSTASGSGYLVQCGTDHAGGDFSSTGASTIEACITACDKTSGCIAAAWVPGACYMKNVINGAVANNAVVGFVLNSTVVSSSTTLSSTTTSTTTSAAVPSATTLTCPSSNGTVFAASNTTSFLVECYADHAAADLSMAYAPSLDACLVLCSNTATCKAVAWIPGSPGPCYMKSAANAAGTNNGVWGAKVVAVPATTSASSSSVVSTSTTLLLSTTSSVLPSTTSTSSSSSVSTSSSAFVSTSTTQISNTTTSVLPSITSALSSSVVSTSTMSFSNSTSSVPSSTVNTITTLSSTDSLLTSTSSSSISSTMNSDSSATSASSSSITSTSSSTSYSNQTTSDTLSTMTTPTTPSSSSSSSSALPTSSSTTSTSSSTVDSSASVSSSSSSIPSGTSTYNFSNTTTTTFTLSYSSETMATFTSALFTNSTLALTTSSEASTTSSSSNGTTATAAAAAAAGVRRDW